MDKDLGTLIEQKLRATPSREFQASPILNEHQWEIDRLLRLHIENEWFLFVGTGLSAFFNPTLYFGHSDDEADLILKCSALFCIATPPPDSELRLMVIEQGSPGLENFLTKNGVQWIYYSGLIPAVEFARQIDVILAKSPTKKHNQRNSINEAEHRVQHALRMVGKYELERSGNVDILVDRGHLRDEAHQLLSHSSYRLLHEVALHRLRPKQPLVLSPEVDWISRTSSVDLLLHSRGDESAPLIAVEVDGPHHLEEKQIAKDRAKDEFLNAIGLPVGQ